MRRRFWICLVLTVPVFISAMGMLIGSHGDLTSRVRWFEMALATPVVLWGGWPFFVRGWRSLVTRNLNMFTLIGLGTGVAYGFSVVACCFPESFRLRFAARAGKSPCISKRRPRSPRWCCSDR